MPDDDNNGEKPAKKPKPGLKTGSGDIDRFLQELEKLRKRGSTGAEPSRAAKPPRVVPKSKAVPVVPVVKPVRKPMVTPPSQAATRVESLPLATIIMPAGPKGPTGPAASPIFRQGQTADAPVASFSGLGVSAGAMPGVRTEFGANLITLLSQRNNVPLAFALMEILGPPLSKKHAQPQPPPPESS